MTPDQLDAIEALAREEPSDWLDIRPEELLAIVAALRESRARLIEAMQCYHQLAAASNLCGAGLDRRCWACIGLQQLSAGADSSSP
jgi:hypothetical protein